jgi:hypothetical protein
MLEPPSRLDSLSRLTADVNVGTNGGTSWTRPSTPHAASDTVLVSTDSHNPAGWLGSSTDPRGLVEQYS